MDARVGWFVEHLVVIHPDALTNYKRKKTQKNAQTNKQIVRKNHEKSQKKTNEQNRERNVEKITKTNKQSNCLKKFTQKTHELSINNTFLITWWHFS